MLLRLVRDKQSTTGTHGKLFVDGEFECFTFEDPVREQKVFGDTCIWPGEYEVSITYSPKFKRDLPLLHGIPQFTAVRIHPGNFASDSEGCILVGVNRGLECVTKSVLAFGQLFPKIEQAWDRLEPISIEIVNDF
jgi:hypothetical protein